MKTKVNINKAFFNCNWNWIFRKNFMWDYDDKLDEYTLTLNKSSYLMISHDYYKWYLTLHSNEGILELMWSRKKEYFKTNLTHRQTEIEAFIFNKMNNKKAKFEIEEPWKRGDNTWLEI